MVLVSTIKLHVSIFTASSQDYLYEKNKGRKMQLYCGNREHLFFKRTQWWWTAALIWNNLIHHSGMPRFKNNTRQLSEVPIPHPKQSGEVRY